MAIDCEGGILRKRVMALILDAARLVALALLLAFDQVILINVVRGLLARRL